MKRMITACLLALIVAGSVSAATARESYDEACQKAALLLKQWESDYTIITALKSSYTALLTALSNYGPEAIDPSDEAAIRTATTRLNTACNNLTKQAESSKNTSVKVSKTAFDPNFHVYLCFGQSNMEGNATPELEDYSGSSKRFLTMAAVSMSSHNRTKGSWYVARPPLCRDWTGLTPADYFGKSLLKYLPDSVSIGVIDVALGGCAIEMFQKEGDALQAYISQQADWLQGYARDYNNQPYQTLIDCARKAQKVGVIKGILLHQGCSNNMQQDWPTKVNEVYQRMLRDLGLSQGDCPLLIGELLRGGACEGHNNVIATCPSKIANCHVVSSRDCPGASDRLHFTALGYRMIGRNYADVMWNILSKREFSGNDYSIKSLEAKQREMEVSPGSECPLYIMLTDEAGKTHDVTSSCQFTCSNPNLLSFSGLSMKTGLQTGEATVTATFTNMEGQVISTEFKVTVRLFPLSTSGFNPSLIGTGTITVTASGARYKATKDGLGGWSMSQGVDLSAYRYLIVDMNKSTTAKASLKIYDSPVLTDDCFSLPLSSPTQVDGKYYAVADLQAMTTKAGKKVDPSHIYTVGISMGVNDGSLVLKNVYVSNDNPTPLDIIPTDMETATSLFDLSGRKVQSKGKPSSALKQGLYIQNGRKYIR